MNTKKKKSRPEVITLAARDGLSEKAQVWIPGNRNNMKLYLEFDELQELADVINDYLEDRIL